MPTTLRSIAESFNFPDLYPPEGWEACDLQSMTRHKMEFLTGAVNLWAHCLNCGFNLFLPYRLLAEAPTGEMVAKMKEAVDEALHRWDDARSWQDWSPEEAW